MSLLERTLSKVLAIRQRSAAPAATAASDDLQALRLQLRTLEAERDDARAQLAAMAPKAPNATDLAALNRLQECLVAPRVLGARLEKLRILLLGTCQVGHLVDAAAMLGYRTDHLLFGSERHAAIPLADTTNYDAIIIGLTLRHIFNDACGGPLDLAHLKGWDIASVLSNCRDLLADRIASLHKLFKTVPGFFLSFIEPSHNYLGNLVERTDPASFAGFVRGLNQQLSDILQSYPNFHVLDANELLNAVGRVHLQDDAVSHATHASFIGDWDIEHDQSRLLAPISRFVTYDTTNQLKNFGYVLLNQVADNLKILRQIDAVKLIIVDLDDTLWRGIAAEEVAEPWSRIEGWPLGFAEALLYFKERGGVLAICSKNNYDETVQRLQEIWGNRLTLDDFASVKINWSPKSSNIGEILTEMNLLPDNALFIDDNPREIAEVRAQFPKLRCLGGNHYDWRRIILRSPETQVAFISAESRQRTELVRARIEREVSSRTMDRGAWLESLEIEQRFALVRSIDHPLFGRTMELINKTNQFNTTGQRWTIGDFVALFRDSGICLLSSLRDKTIDNGMTGIVIVKGSEIVQAVLSCRVFGLGVETGMARMATAIALMSGDHATAHIVDTGRNFACHGYFSSVGFETIDDHYEAARPCEFPEWIKASFVAEDSEIIVSEDDWLASIKIRQLA